MKATRNGKRSKTSKAEESGVHFDSNGPTYREPIPPDEIVRMKDELLDKQIALDALLVESEQAQASAKVAAKLWKAQIDVKRREVSVLAAEVKSGMRDRPRQQTFETVASPAQAGDLAKLESSLRACASQFAGEPNTAETRERIKRAFMETLSADLTPAMVERLSAEFAIVGPATPEQVERLKTAISNFGKDGGGVILPPREDADPVDAGGDEAPF